MKWESYEDAKKRTEAKQQANLEWFFNGGYEGMNKLQQVEYLVEECGYSEDGAWDLVYGLSGY